MAEAVLVKALPELYKTHIIGGNHTILADEKTKVGGGDTGMNPFELLLSSLGACTSITMRMYANRKGWIINDLAVQLTINRVEDHTTIYRDITLEGDLSEEQRSRLLQVAKACPVAKILEGQIVIQSKLTS
jgi:putative redox protein